MTKITRRAPDAVSPIELFFDLVFVFAVSQLTHHLSNDLNWRGVAETSVLLAAVFSAWAYTTFEATLLNVERAQTQRMLLAVMVLGLFMNAAVGRAFGTGSWAFVVPFLAIQFGRPIRTIVTAPNRVLHEHYIRVSGWAAVSAPFWLLGAAVDRDQRLAWWALAAVIDLTGTCLAHPFPGRVLRSENIEFDAAHLIERCRLFLIIALGEVVLATGTAISDARIDAITVITGTSAWAIVVALWALYFAGSDEFVNRHVEATNDPILASRLTLAGESAVVAGLIAVSIGNELVIAHPHQTTTATLALLIFGGGLVYVVVQTVQLWLVVGKPSPARLSGVAALAASGTAALVLPAFASLALATAVLTLLVLAVLRENHRSSIPMR
jgi:low temperature requirement protein LtrA